MIRRYFVLIFFIGIVFLLFNCSSKESKVRPDPKEILIKYRELRNDWKLAEAYALLADTCKSYISQEEFVAYNMQPDSVRNNYRFTIIGIDSLPVYENSDFSRYKV